MLVLICTLVDDYLDRRGPLREEHLGLIRAAHERGELSQAGVFSDPYDRSLFVWYTDDRAVIEAFVAADPYAANGLVQSYEIRTWNVVL